jgi:hypothetical protein
VIWERRRNFIYKSIDITHRIVDTERVKQKAETPRTDEMSVKINYRFTGDLDDEVWEGSFDFPGDVSSVLRPNGVIGGAKTTKDAVLESDIFKMARKALRADHGSQDYIKQKIWVDAQA